MARLEAGFRWDEEFGEKPFFEGEVEPCINGGACVWRHFGRPTESLAVVWSASSSTTAVGTARRRRASRSSFHTTICVLEGLLEYERAVGSAPEIAAARRRGEDYLLERASSGDSRPARSRIRRS